MVERVADAIEVAMWSNVSEVVARAAIKEVRDVLQEEAGAIPLGAEDRGAGSSTYNHVKVAIRLIDAALEEPEE